MARSVLVDDGLWELVKPLLPDRMPQRTGRPRVSDRAAFTAIVFVLVTGVPWRLVPQQIGCFRGDRLAAVAGVAAHRGVGETAPRASPPLERRWPDRLVAGGRGLKPHPQIGRASCRDRV